MRKNLLGRTAKIVSDNENYDKYRGQELVITHVAYNEKEHPGYDKALECQALCDFKVKATGKDVGFSLYEYEFELV
jgi:hypothetical protein